MAGGSVGFVTYRYYPLGIAFTPVPHEAHTHTLYTHDRTHIVVFSQKLIFRGGGLIETLKLGHFAAVTLGGMCAGRGGCPAPPTPNRPKDAHTRSVRMTEPT